MATNAVVGRSAPNDDKRWRQVDVRMRRLGYRPDGLIEVLHTTQEVFGYLDDEALSYVGESLGVPPSKVYGVATFYSHFLLKPPGPAYLRGLHGHGVLHQTVPAPCWPP